MDTLLGKFDNFLGQCEWVEFEGTFALDRDVNGNVLPVGDVKLWVTDDGFVHCEVLDRRNFETVTDSSGGVVENPNYDGRVIGGQSFIVPGVDGDYVVPDNWDDLYPPEKTEVYMCVPFVFNGKPYRFIAGMYED